MARLIQGSGATKDYTAEGFATTGGSPTFDVGTSRSNGVSLKCGGSSYARIDGAYASGGTSFARAFIRATAWTTASTGFASLVTFDGSAGVGAGVDKSGNLSAANYVSGTALTGVGATTPLNLNQWYCLEVKIILSTLTVTTVEVRLDGVVLSTNVISKVVGSGGQVFFGDQFSSLGQTIFVSDWAVNDSTTASQNSYPGPLAQVIWLPPTSDNARTGFTAGAGATTSLFDAENNTPPTGATSPGTNGSQIGSANSNTTDNYVANLETPTAAGVPAGSTPLVARALAMIGQSSATQRTLGLQSTANPVIAEATGTPPAGAAGAYPTNWARLVTAMSVGPSITLGSAPALEIRKGTATTDNVMACLMGMYVEFGQVPQETVLPVITGSLTVSSVLTCSTGTWSNAPSGTTYDYQWKSNGVNVGTNASTYTTAGGDAGHTITCVVTATNTRAGATATAAGVVIGGGAPTSLALPVITGTWQVGQVLTSTHGDWTGSPTSYAYQWQRSGVNIASATASTYTLVSADKGTTIACVVTATNASGSTASSAVASATVGGTIAAPIVGMTLTESGDTWSNTPTSFALQWLRDGVPIAGASASTYVTAAADVAAAISVQVIASNSAGPSLAALSAATGNVTDTPNNAGGAALPTISGTAALGQPLAVTPGTWTNTPTSLTYQWRSAGLSILGATGNTYMPTASDVGNTIDCVIYAWNVGGAATATAAATGAVAGSGSGAPVLTVTGTTITWPAIGGATGYQGAISTAAEGAPTRTTSYVQLGNVTTWTPPSVPGQTIFYGVEVNPTTGPWSSEVSIAWPGTVPTSHSLRMSVNNTDGWGAALPGGGYVSTLFTNINCNWNRFDVGQGGGMGTVLDAQSKNSKMKTLIMYTQGTDGNGNGLSTGQVTSDITALIPQLNSYFASTGQPKELEFLNESSITLNGAQYGALYHAAHVLTAPAGIKLLAVGGTATANQQNGGSGTWFQALASALPGGAAEADAFTWHPYCNGGDSLTDKGSDFYTNWANIVEGHDASVAAGFSATLPWYFTELGITLNFSGMTQQRVATDIVTMLNQMVASFPWVVFFNWYAALDDSEAGFGTTGNWGMLNQPPTNPTVRPVFTAYGNWIAQNANLLG